MEFTNEIWLARPTDAVFAALTDVERVAACLPGARVEGRDGNAYRGAMRIKVGPIVADYHGSLSFDELDPGARRAVLLASGEESAGQGSAEARIVSSVVEDGDGARVVVETDLQVRGRVAQFGSGAMEKIAKRMFADFAKNLEALMAGDEEPQPQGGTRPVSPSETEAPVRPLARVGQDQREDSLDVVGLLGQGLCAWLRRSGVPILIALVLGYLLGERRRMSS